MIRRFGRVLIGVAIVVAMVLGVGWILIHTLGVPDPVFQNKPIAYWLEQMKSSDPEVSNRVSGVLDAEIIPQFTKTLLTDTTDSRIRTNLVLQLNQLAGVEIPWLNAEMRRAGAATLLGQIGPRASRAIPALFKSSKVDSSKIVQGAASRSIAQVCVEPTLAVPVLLDCLDDPQNGVPEAAMNALGKFGSASKAAVPKLMALGQSANKSVQRAARNALQKIDPEAAAKVAAAPASPSPP